MKILKHLKKSILSICIIIGLLVVQAICDLSLPDFTSRIVNVGVQQSGIESATPKVIRKEVMNNLLIFVSDNDKTKIMNNYRLVNKTSKDYKKLVKEYPLLKSEELYVLKDKDTDLTDIISSSMMLNTLVTSDKKEYLAFQDMIKKELPDALKELPLIEVFKLMDENTLQGFKDRFNEEIKKMPQSILEQSAIMMVKEEYIKVGIDIGKLQTNYIIIAGLKMLAIALFSMISTIGVGFLGALTAAKLARDLRNDVYNKTLSFSRTEFKKFGVASLITRSTNDIQQIQMVMVFTLRTIFYAPILGIGGVIKALSTNSTMTWIIGLVLLIILSLMILMFGLVLPKFKLVQKLIDKLNLVTREILTGIPVIRAFSNQKYEEKRFDKANNDIRKTTLFVDRAMSLLMPTMMFVMNSVCILIVWKAAHGINDGIMQVGDMLAFIQYTMQIVMSFLMISIFSIMMPRAGVSWSRVLEILKTEPTVGDNNNPKSFSKRVRGLVEFKEVSFHYPDSMEDVLTDISFVAKPGEVVAFIGSTGSGKSTLINLIPRLFDATKGEILIDGINVKDVKLHDLHEKIGYVPQKGILFSGTIASNLRYGNKEATDEEIEKAATIAQAKDFILEKDKKYLSPISQGGTNVSGGQKQRLSIARAIVTNPEIYIFDDSFSALDFKTDSLLRQALKKEIKDSTILIVAQRVSTIMNADQIIVLDEGKVVGKGTHKELLETCEIYKEIAASQLTKEELENA